MTDSVIQFNYGDGNHLTTIYVRANTIKEEFIPILENICADIDKAERFHEGRLNWENMCLEFIKRLSEWVDRPDGIKITSETKEENCNVIYRHMIQPIAEDYSNPNIPTSKTLNIVSKYASGSQIFKGTLYNFVLNIKDKNEEKE